MDLAILSAVLFLGGIFGALAILIHFIKTRQFSFKRLLIFLGLAAAVVCAVVLMVPRPLEGFDGPIAAQNSLWSGTEESLPIAEPERLPPELEIRRYRLGDTPMPGHSFGTPTAVITLNLEDGTLCRLYLCPERPASCQIQPCDGPQLGEWFLTPESAAACIAAFLPELSQ